jgi:heptose I phosphotransferase
MLWIDETLRPHVPQGREFDFAMRLPGHVVREQKNRRMIRSSIGGRSCFIKTHRPAAWGEIVKNAARGRWPTLTAEPEWQAIHRMRDLGILTVKPLGYGTRGRFPDQMESFIITEDLAGFVHLSDLPPQFVSLPVRQRALVRRALTHDVARIARLMHCNGLNHRDFYLNHFMLPARDWSAWRPGEDLRVHVIDLHRTQIRRCTPIKWITKDISGLLFSAFDAGLTSRDCLRFLNEYWLESWRGRWPHTRGWRRRVVRRAVSLYRSERGRPPRLPADLASFA